MLKTRVLTALILLPLVLMAIFWLPPVYFAGLFAGLIMVGAWEWSGMIGYTHTAFRWVYMLIVLLGIVLANALPILLPLSVALLVWLWVAAGIFSYQANGSGWGFKHPIIRSLVGFIILVASWVAIVTLDSDAAFGSAWLLLVLFIIWGADVGAYFVGRFCGKQPLASRVSPKKTWAGFVGGMLTAIIIAAIGGLFFHLSLYQYVILLGLAVLTALFSVIGDLGVSLVKRISGVKDSGHIFPGHGGLLDRLDSVAAASVIFTFIALLLRF